MSDVALISGLSWRSIEMQKAAFPDMPHFVAPDEIPTMLRPSQRNGKINIHVSSLAVIADNIEDLRIFVRKAYDRGAVIFCKDTGAQYCKRTKIIGRVVDDFIVARRVGAARAGGEATAAKSAKDFWDGFAKIKDRWHLPAKKKNASAHLLAEANTSRNTTKSYLGFTREEWQSLTDAQRNRVLERAYGK